MDWLGDLFDEHGATMLEVLIGLIVLIIVVAMMDGSKRRDEEKPPDNSREADKHS